MSNDLQPFDWLTSASSLESILQPLLSNTSSNRVLHVGCGSSILGEQLIEDIKYNTSTVVNVDNDICTLQRMQQRWKDKVESSRLTNKILEENAMQFITADFTLPNALKQYTDDSSNIAKFDMVLDKSTLDCMLCTDTGAIGLLLETYRCLTEDGGIYFVISFHPPDFIKPLLENLPGAHWDVECTSTPRKIEVLNYINDGSTSAKSEGENETTQSNNTNNTFTWSSGTFQPNEHYVRNVTVLICRRRPPSSSLIHAADNQLDWDQVYEHVCRINNEWYQQTNPMVTKQRVQTMERAFAASAGTNGVNKTELSLEQCYPILFTDGERENLLYEDFLDDWQSFLKKYSPVGGPDTEQLPTDRMSFTTAIAFLHVMQ